MVAGVRLHYHCSLKDIAMRCAARALHMALEHDVSAYDRNDDRRRRENIVPHFESVIERLQ